MIAQKSITYVSGLEFLEECISEVLSKIGLSIKVSEIDFQNLVALWHCGCGLEPETTDHNIPSYILQCPEFKCIILWKMQFTIQYSWVSYTQTKKLVKVSQTVTMINHDPFLNHIWLTMTNILYKVLKSVSYVILQPVKYYGHIRCINFNTRLKPVTL